MIKRRKPLLQPRKAPARIWRSHLYIRELRESRGLSLTDFAKAVGKSKGMISQIENGMSGASPQTLEDIARFFRLQHVGMLFEPPPPKGFRRFVNFIPVPNNNSTNS